MQDFFSILNRPLQDDCGAVAGDGILFFFIFSLSQKVNVIIQHTDSASRVRRIEETTVFVC